MNRADIDIFNIQMKLHENWDSKYFNSKSIDAILNFIEQIPSSPSPPSMFYFPLTSSISQIIAVVLIAALSITIVVITLFFCRNRINLCCCLRDKIKDKTHVEINPQQFDRHSADQLKKYYQLIR